MAILIPTEPLDFHGSPGEQEVFDAMRKLDARCYVFHSLRWIRDFRDRTPNAAQGEGDFLVFDPLQGLLVLEVKSGGIRFEAGCWLQKNLGTGEENRMQDPEAQADRTRWFLINHLKKVLGDSVRCPVYHAVWFPSVNFPKNGLPPNLHPPMVLDRGSLKAPSDSINAAFAFGSSNPRPVKIGNSDIRRILNAVAPSVCAAPSMRHALEVRERAFLRLTEEQARVLEFLEEQQRAVIGGAAGTGKTVVALQRARRLADAGERVLFLCYNGPLRQFLLAHHGAPRLTFHTFDSLAAEYCPEEAGDFEKARTALLDLLTGSGAPSLEHVIIDEGQDFENDWIDAIEACTTRTFYVFYDRNQLVQRDRIPPWVERAECRLVLRRNCRMTTQVARMAYRCAVGVLPLPPDTVDGPKPRLYGCETRQQAAMLVAQVVAKLLGEREYQPHEIAILTLKTPETSVLSSFDRVGTSKVVDVPKKNCVVFSSARRFKGLEARAVVLVDVDVARLADPTVRSLLYVGASRAVHELHVVLHGSTREAVATAATAIGGAGKTSARALSMTLGATWEEAGDAEVVE